MRSSASPAPGPPVPWELWAFAATFLLETAAQVVLHGPKADSSSLVGSVVLGVVVVPFFSAGVVRARGVRTGIVAVLLVLAVVAGLAGLATDPSLPASAVTVVSALQCWLLWRYTTTRWWSWQRTRPSGGRSLVPVLAVAVVVGVLAGVAAEPVGPEGLNISFHLSL